MIQIRNINFEDIKYEKNKEIIFQRSTKAIGKIFTILHLVMFFLIEIKWS